MGESYIYFVFSPVFVKSLWNLLGDAKSHSSTHAKLPWIHVPHSGQ